jgi:hypothetical protein
MRLTQEDASGTRFLRPGALPFVVAAICVPVVGALAFSILTTEGTGLGLAAGALAVATLLVIAARARPGGALEVAARSDAERRLLVIAEREITPALAGEIAARSHGAADVRLVIPLQSRALERWLSAEDRARDQAQTLLAHSAGALVAAGLPVSGSLGDSDPAQALEDELRGFAADELVVVGADGSDDRLSDALDRVELPVAYIAGD